MSSITKALAEHHWMYRDNKAGQALLTLAIDAKGDVVAFQRNLEQWYNDAMDRVYATLDEFKEEKKSLH